MKAFLRPLSLIIVLCLCTACFTTLALTAVVLSNITPGTKVQISGKTIGQIPSQPQAALLETDGGGTICIVYDFVRYKDGKKIKDKFVRGGIYQYEDPDGTEHYVPIYTRAKAYKTLWPIAAELDVNTVEEEPTRPEVYI
jgi:hypothetical protein